MIQAAHPAHRVAEFEGLMEIVKNQELATALGLDRSARVLVFGTEEGNRAA